MSNPTPITPPRSSGTASPGNTSSQPPLTTHDPTPWLTPRGKWSLKWGGLVLCILVLAYSFLMSQLRMQAVANTRTVEHGSNTKMASDTALSALFLNYRTIAADLAWIRMIIDYGDKIALSRKNLYMLHNGTVIAHLDPYFRHVYDWVPGAYLANNISPTTKQLLDLTELLNFGQVAFPAEGRISYDAAVNFLNNTPHPTPYDIVVQTDMAIALLERAMTLPETPDRAALLIEWFKRKRATTVNRLLAAPFFVPARWYPQKYWVVKESVNVDKLAQFILATDEPDVRARLLDQLRAQDDQQNKKLIRRIEALSRQYQRRHSRDWRNFMPPNQWAALVE